MMPRLDGTGPNGQGSQTGRKMGYCNQTTLTNYRRPRFNRRWAMRTNDSFAQTTNRTWLENRKTQLEFELDAINKQLNSTVTKE